MIASTPAVGTHRVKYRANAEEKNHPDALEGRGYPATVSVAERIRATIALARRIFGRLLTRSEPRGLGTLVPEELLKRTQFERSRVETRAIPPG
jgi:hypothetical protein